MLASLAPPAAVDVCAGAHDVTDRLLRGRLNDASRSIDNEWRSIRFRLRTCTHAPCGPSVRVDEPAKAKTTHTNFHVTGLFKRAVYLCELKTSASASQSLVM